MRRPFGGDQRSALTISTHTHARICRQPTVPFAGKTLDTHMTSKTNIDMEKYRLRRFVDRLIAMDEVEIHDKPVPLTALSSIIESSPRAHLFNKAGPEQVEIVAGTGSSRKRLA